MSGEGVHRPVMLGEVVQAAGGARRVVDATLGDGGHAEALLASGAELLGVDRDPDAIRIARARLGERGIRYLEGSFGAPDILRAVAGFRPDFVLLDLGVSSRQIDQSERGFSFRPGAPLDMRMTPVGPTAADLLNTRPAAALEAWFSDYGDEPKARRLAAEIVRRRTRTPFAVSDHLVNAIRAVQGPRAGPPAFARLFQAVRIAVNDELAELERALPAYRDALTDGGALAVISYHSGEDRLAKHAFREWSRSCICPTAQPVCTCRGHSLGREAPRGGTVPDAAEIAANPRARSARLRVFRKANPA